MRPNHDPILDLLEIHIAGAPNADEPRSTMSPSDPAAAELSGPLAVPALRRALDLTVALALAGRIDLLGTRMADPEARRPVVKITVDFGASGMTWNLFGASSGGAIFWNGVTDVLPEGLRRGIQNDLEAAERASAHRVLVVGMVDTSRVSNHQRMALTGLLAAFEREASA